MMEESLLMIKRQITSFTIRVFIALTQFGCNSDGPSAGCEANNGIVWEYVAPEDVMVRVYENGEAYFVENGGCTFAAQFFTPGFFEQNYVRTPTSISAKLDDGTLLPLFESFVEDFEGHENALDMIILDPEDRTRFYSSFTLQSPSAKTVSEYVDLRQCILDGSCDFIDNRFDLVADPEAPDNTVLRDRQEITDQFLRDPMG